MEQKDSSDGGMMADEAIGALAELNKLTYEQQPSISVASSFTVREYLCPLGEAEMGVDELIFDIPSGNAFVDLKQSWISMEMNLEGLDAPGDNTYDFRIPNGSSYATMVERYRLVHATGVELDSIKGGGSVWTNIQQWYTKGAEQRNTEAQVMNLANEDGRPFDNLDNRFGDLITESTDRGVNALLRSPASIGPRKIMIPLAAVFSWARNESLAPPYLLAGSRLHINLTKKEVFFTRPTLYADYQAGDGYVFGNGANPPKRTDWTANPWPAGSRIVMRRMKLHLASYTLTTAMNKHIEVTSANEGLQWSWEAVRHQTVLNAEQDFTINLQQALARVNGVVIHARLNDRTTDQNEDSFSALPWLPDYVRDSAKEVDGGVISPTTLLLPSHEIDGTCVELQARIGGSLYMPITPYGDGGVNEFYWAALSSFNSQHRKDQQVGPTLQEFAGVLMYEGPTYTYTSPAVGATQIAIPAENASVGEGFYPAVTKASRAIMAIDFTTSADLKESGIAISPARQADIHLRFKTMSGTRARRYDVYLPHTRVVTLYLGQVAIPRD
jgi:hypothetical protein